MMKLPDYIGPTLFLLSVCNWIQLCDAIFGNKYSVSISSNSKISKVYVRGRKLAGPFSNTPKFSVPLAACVIAIEFGAGGSHQFALSNSYCDIVSSSSSVSCITNIAGYGNKWYKRSLRLSGNRWKKAAEVKLYSSSDGVCLNAFWVKPQPNKSGKVWCRISLKRNAGWSPWTPCKNNMQTRTCNMPKSDCGGSYCRGPQSQACQAITTAASTTLTTKSSLTTGREQTTAATTVVSPSTVKTTAVSPTTAADYCNEGCSSYDGAQHCTSCEQHFFYNGSCCQQCTASCSQCYNGSVCTLCDSGYTLTSQYRCQDCPQTRNCETCESSTICSQCALGYIKNSTTQSCDACPEHCLTCTDASTCTDCSPPYATVNGICKACSAGCQFCTSPTECGECAQTYYLNSNAICEKCTDPECLNCDNATFCTLCDDHFYLNDDSECSECGRNCSSCNATYCLICDPGHYRTDDWNCTECTPNCYFCGNNTFCESCISRYYSDGLGNCLECLDVNCRRCSFSTITNSTTCQECADGYVLNANNVCQGEATTSASTVQPGDATTSASTVQPLCPTACASFNPFNGYCTACNSGYYLNSTCCSACPQHCLACLNATACTGSCEDGYSFSTQLTCLNCTDPNCEQCATETRCVTCYSQYKLDDTGSCKRCPDHCDTCSNTTYCTDCEFGYVATSDGGCFSCPSNCSVCSENSCEICDPGFYLTSGNTCEACFENCVTCSDADTCISCDQGNDQEQNYYLNATNGCSACVLKCLSCNETGCQTCKDGYYPNADGSSCEPCMSNCQSCTSNTECLNCVSGFYKNAGTCEPCTLPNCAYCESNAETGSDDCQTCLSGDPPSNGACP